MLNKLRRKNNKTLADAQAAPSDIASSLRAVVSPEWYLAVYKDVAEAGTNPVEHFLQFGRHEGRHPNAVFYTSWYRQTYLINDPDPRPLEHFIKEGFSCGFRPNPIACPRYCAERYGFKDAVSFIHALLHDGDMDQLNPWFSRRLYRTANPDLADYESTIENHFINIGLNEQRVVAPAIRAIKKSRVSGEKRKIRNPFAEVLETLTIDREQYDIVRDAPPNEIIEQIRNQSIIDPDVTAIGPDCFPYSKQYMATDLDTRGLIRHQYLLNNIPRGIDSIVVLPRLQVGGAEKYAANLLKVMTAEGRRCLLITTDSWAADDRAALSLDILSPMRDVRLVSLREGLLSTWKPETVFALLLMKASPKQIFIINSEIGLKTIQKYGRTLSNITKLYCAFFSESPGAIGAPYSARYLRGVIAHSTVISDNLPAIENWKRRLGPAVTERFVCVPNYIELPSERMFEKLVAPRLARKRAPTNCNALWLSRWEPFKAIDVLLDLLRKFPGLHVDAYGPSDPGFKMDDLPKNLELMGTIAHPGDIDVSDYDMMIFTSYFEGMPNAVLEMAALGVPIVASDVGGLRDTFADDTIAFVTMNGSPDAIATRFKTQIERLMGEDRQLLKDRIFKARTQLTRHHSLSEVTRRVLSLDAA